ncbi:hypothetical protein [Collinsella tanakaei]|uniref:hypothetical protein n=1 Tax=Collinsella tanakaei TaxID=626935 RepID=UPI001F4808CB|nr:hypothetical protein [Collinsella tanakaei]MCF2622338.1 hypothetical protein [Collinsella tanakaei]
MHVYETRAQFDAELSSVKKWMRVGQALDIAPTLLQDVAYSIGDSLTYWWDRTSALSTPDMVGTRRYLSVVAPIDGEAHVVVAPKADLAPTRAYSDLDDRERFEAADVKPVVVPAGGILVVDEQEAFRILPDQDVAAVMVRVTIEGYSFPNK